MGWLIEIILAIKSEYPRILAGSVLGAVIGLALNPSIWYPVAGAILVPMVTVVVIVIARHDR